ncbi:fimbria/pilus periplasmic chaperone [Pseudomonas yamanorum]|uniref:fimbrial biogenesis chaperone n=1 Tax=Pseudomonas yamanorum TaxID=515393 RepID=UPI0015A1B827|nr:fimbria/pilus periplasmic chaperone [Pseudomonas yamanorum]NWE42653.1 fimbria/pilus periplasmic chaperone [Pseudomonas yamanorum]
MFALSSLPAGIVLFCLTMGVAQAGIVINGTRQIYPEPRQEITVQVTNDDASAPRLVQVWMDGGDPQAAAEHSEVPFSISPPVFRVDPGKSQAIRLAYTREPLPSDRESVFWLNVLEVPPNGAGAQADANQVRFAFRIRTKVFFRPQDLPGTAHDAADQLQWRVLAGRPALLRVHNPTPYYVTFHEVALVTGAGRMPTEHQGMVAPYASLDLALPGTLGELPTGAQVQFQYINDFGGFSAPRQASFNDSHLKP